MMWITSLLGSWQLKAAVIITAFCAGWIVNGWRYAAQEVEVIKARQAMIDAYREEEAKSAKLLEGKLKELRANEKVIERERIKLVDRPVYNNECLDADGVQLVERARVGKTHTDQTDTGKSSGKVPGTK